MISYWKVNNSMSEEHLIKRRGRPFGHRLDENTKKKIRQRRLGTHHSQETRDKISRSLSEYFKGRDSFSKSINHEYSEVREAVEWIGENSDELAKESIILTERSLLYSRQLEISLGHEIEVLFGHNATPEFLLLLKEELSENKMSVKELISLL
jgi:hypothetical protein